MKDVKWGGIILVIFFVIIGLGIMVSYNMLPVEQENNYNTYNEVSTNVNSNIIEEKVDIEEINLSETEIEKREAEEQAKKEAEEQARKEAEEQAKREAEEQARKEAERIAAQEQAQKQQQAQAQTQKPATTTSTPQTTNSRTVYVTPTGKRYHYSPTCGGKNSTASTLSNAQARGLTPCKKCAQ